MSKPYTVTFTDAGKAVAEASSSLAAVEDIARRELAELDITDIRNLGFHCFRLADDKEFICYPLDGATLEINAIVRHEDLGRIEDKADWLGLSGEVIFPVPAIKK